MKATIVLDNKAEKELEKLTEMENASKSELIRKAINDLYLKEKRAQENLKFFIDMYNGGNITKDILFLLLPSKDAEAIIIGAKTGKEAVEIAKNLGS